MQYIQQINGFTKVCRCITLVHRNNSTVVKIAKIWFQSVINFDTT